jgi:hypothetical protein
MTDRLPSAISDWAARNPQDDPPFADYRDGNIYYIDGRLTRNKARHVACEEASGWYKRTVARRCWMRNVQGEEALELSDGEFEQFFVVCKRDEPGAVVMWQVTVAP